MELKYEPNRFKNLEQAKEFYYDKLHKWESEFVYIGDQLTLLCCTAMAYDDEVEIQLTEAFIRIICNALGFKREVNMDFDISDYIKPIVENLMDELEDYGNFKVEYLYDEF